MCRAWLLLLLTLVSVAHANSQIPNNGFENWTNNNPNGWGTMNPVTASSSVFTAEKGVPGFPGAGYLSLASKAVPGKGVVHGVAVSGEIDTVTRLPKSGFPFSSRPQDLIGAYQYMIFGGDFGFIHVYLTKWNAGNSRRDTIALAQRTLTGMVMNWTPFVVNLNYLSASFPDSAVIILSASGANAGNNDYLYIDNLAFNGLVPTSVLSLPGSDVALKLFPNPVRGGLSFDFMATTPQSFTAVVVDLQGKVIVKKMCSANSGYNSFFIETSFLAKGTYILKLVSRSHVEEQKFLVE